MVGADPAELIGNDVKIITLYLQNLGFKEIQVIPIPIDSEKHDQVEKIYINGDPWFQKDSMIASDAKIIITYYSKPKGKHKASFE